MDIGSSKKSHFLNGLRYFKKSKLEEEYLTFLNEYKLKKNNDKILDDLKILMDNVINNKLLIDEFFIKFMVIYDENYCQILKNNEMRDYLSSMLILIFLCCIGDDAYNYLRISVKESEKLLTYSLKHIFPFVTNKHYTFKYFNNYYIGLKSHLIQQYLNSYPHQRSNNNLNDNNNNNHNHNNHNNNIKFESNVFDIMVQYTFQRNHEFLIFLDEFIEYLYDNGMSKDWESVCPKSKEMFIWIYLNIFCAYAYTDHGGVKHPIIDSTNYQIGWYNAKKMLVINPKKSDINLSNDPYHYIRKMFCYPTKTITLIRDPFNLISLVELCFNNNSQKISQLFFNGFVDKQWCFNIVSDSLPNIKFPNYTLNEFKTMKIFIFENIIQKYFYIKCDKCVMISVIASCLHGLIRLINDKKYDFVIEVLKIMNKYLEYPTAPYSNLEVWKKIIKNFHGFIKRFTENSPEISIDFSPWYNTFEKNEENAIKSMDIEYDSQVNYYRNLKYVSKTVTMQSENNNNNNNNNNNDQQSHEMKQSEHKDVEMVDIDDNNNNQKCLEINQSTNRDVDMVPLDINNNSNHSIKSPEVDITMIDNNNNNQKSHELNPSTDKDVDVVLDKANNHNHNHNDNNNNGDHSSESPEITECENVDINHDINNNNHSDHSSETPEFSMSDNQDINNVSDHSIESQDMEDSENEDIDMIDNKNNNYNNVKKRMRDNSMFDQSSVLSLPPPTKRRKILH